MEVPNFLFANLSNLSLYSPLIIGANLNAGFTIHSGSRLRAQKPPGIHSHKALLWQPRQRVERQGKIGSKKGVFETI
jgi:hypothetical protein